MAGVNAEQLQQLLQACRQGAGGGQTARLQPFSDPDPAVWITWRKQFENLARKYNWVRREGKRTLQTYIHGRALDALEEAVTVDQIDNDDEEGDNAFSLEDMLNAYETRLLQGQGTEAAYNEFTAATQAIGETLSAWHGRLLTLFKRAFPDINAANRANNKMLLRQFTIGIRNPEVRKGILQTRVNVRQTYAHLFTTATDVEAGLTVEAEAAKIWNPTTPAPSTSGLNALAQPEPDQTLAALPDKTCWNCNQKGHLQDTCPQQRRTYNQPNPRPNQPAFRGRGTGRGRGGRGRGSNKTFFPKQNNASKSNKSKLYQAIQALIDAQGGSGSSQEINSLGGGDHHDQEFQLNDIDFM